MVRDAEEKKHKGKTKRSLKAVRISPRNKE
jgi:hypothetical protein